MIWRFRTSALLLAIVSITAFNQPANAQAQKGAPAESDRAMLERNWAIQQSCKVPEKGEVISTTAFKPQGWYPATVPGAVVANLVANKTPGYPDPYVGMNMRKFPGAGYPIGAVFAREEMPKDSPFLCSWWYRTEFTVPAANQQKQNWLNFCGINYRANIWLNGKQIANREQIAGAWRIYEVNVTPALVYGKPNVLAVEVFAPGINDLGINFVDWNPTPPDKNMGLWREVYLATSGPVAVRHAFVDTKVANTLDAADLFAYAFVNNGSAQAVRGRLEVTIDGKVEIAQAVQLGPHEIKEVAFTPELYPQLHLANPRLWWPAQLGPQELYHAEFRFVADDKVSDSAAIDFGVREVTSEFTDKGHRLFKINGKKILIRGAGYTSDMLLQATDKELEQHIDYTRDMNMNTIRLEGKIEPDHFFDYADKVGMLVMPGWCCCDAWELWKDWTGETKNIADESLRSQLLRIRHHPSVIMWLNGSDFPPVAEVEQRYLDVEKQVRWPTPVVSSATQKPGPVTGPSGVKMTGPYDYVPPSYWLLDKDKGGAHGFNTETSPGPAIPVAESIRKFIPADHLWPIDEVWNYHAGGGQFKNLNIYTKAMNQRYGPSGSMEEYAMKGQAAAYEGERAMFEAFGRNKYTSTGVIQWMLNNAWPSMIWHLYDWYGVPGGGYFGTKKANEPLHVQYSYDDQSIVVVNSLYKDFPGVKVRAQVLNFDLAPKFEKDATLDIKADSSTRALTIPAVGGLSKTYFLRLWLTDSAGKPVSENFYWLSTQPDELAWDKYEWYYTPAKQQMDLTALKQLPQANVTGSATQQSGQATVTLENPGKSLAFLVRLRVTDSKGEDVVPAFFEDNYFSLFPGEKREVKVSFDAKKVAGQPVVRLDGWNVKPVVLK